MKRPVRLLWRIFIIGILLIGLLIISIDMGWLGYMPKMSELENPSSAVSTEVLANDGTLLGRYYVQDRSTSKYSEISKNVFNALIATEDERFYEHSGIDAKATAAIPFYLLRGSKRGSSTITQQLAKNLFGRKDQSLFTLPLIKLKEWILAVKLERNLTKNEIITSYLNTVPFGDNVYGIKNASLTFFNKTPDKVSPDEAAVLVGMLKGNTIYNPRSHPDNALQRRNTVLAKMAENGYITPGEAKDLETKPIKLDYHKLDYHEGMAPYFRQVLELELKKICKDLKKQDGSSYDIYKDGLKVFTTIDPRMQRYAEEAVDQHLANIQKLFVAQSGYKDGTIWAKHQDVIENAIKNSDRYQNMKDEDINEKEIRKSFTIPVKMKVFAYNKAHAKDTVMTPIDSIKYMRMFLQAGFMVMDPFTGEVKAWVGGIDHNFYQVDHVNINTKRQVGSTIKPLLYCLAVDNGISPCSNVQTTGQSFAGMDHIYNAGGSKFGSMSMKKALANSINNAALYLVKQTGIPAFVDFVHKCGITSTVEKYPSSALGASDISLYEMMNAYTMFPTKGINTQPVFIIKIEDKNGNLIKSFAPQQKEIINPNTAFKMVKLMRGVVDFGTGQRMRSVYGIKNDVAGKTGTTNSQADGWFLGYTPQLLAGAWVGCDDRFLRFRSEALGQGAAAALPIWALFMKKVYADRSLGIDPNLKFEQPADFDDCDVTDPTSYGRMDLNNHGGANTNDDEGKNNDDAQPSTDPTTNDYGNGNQQ